MVAALLAALPSASSRLHSIPQIPRHDGVLLAGIDIALVGDLTDVGPVVQQGMEIAA